MTKIEFRPYQQTCVDKAIQWAKTSIEPAVIDAAPAAGKSFMIAGISDALTNLSGGKKVLNLAPSKELVVQNHEKMLLTGHPASIFSSSAGSKSTRHNIVFGTPLTVKNSISRFLSGYCAVNVDEAHGITPTIISIIDAMREGNPNLRVFGWSGTPFRLGSGYIYRVDPNGRVMPEQQAKDPYFAKCLHRVSAQEMLDQGFLCPMDVGAPLADGYDTGALRLNTMGKFDPKDEHAVYVGQGRKTAAIVYDVVQQAKNRYGGCMLFAATLDHAKEIMASLPPGNSGCVLGNDAWAKDGKVKGRGNVIKAYRNQKFKYLVSVGTLTTGFDVAHTSVIATLRRSESASLIQQILGRAWRLDPMKPRALWLDYTGQVDDMFPDGDIYAPEIKAAPKKEDATYINVTCPMCSGVNEFSARKNDEGYNVTEDGYFADLTGQKIECEHGPIPSHYGRRCLNMVPVGGGKLDQCQQRWTSKECAGCGAANDIAARRCCECGGELIDPNEKLMVEFRALKRSPHNRQCDEVVAFEARETVSGNGNEVVRLDFKTPYRSFSWWVQKSPKSQFAMRQLELYQSLNGEPPKTVEYQKDAASGFYRVYSFNGPKDEEPEV